MHRRKTIVIASAVLALVAGAALGQEGRRARPGRADNALKVGQKAPEFTLKSQDGKQEFNLASFRGKKPVVLFFGSYT